MRRAREISFRMSTRRKGKSSTGHGFGGQLDRMSSRPSNQRLMKLDGPEEPRFAITNGEKPNFQRLRSRVARVAGGSRTLLSGQEKHAGDGGRGGGGGGRISEGGEGDGSVRCGGKILCPEFLHQVRHRDRRFLFSAIMQADRRPDYRKRLQFWCSWKTLPDVIMNNNLDHDYTPGDRAKAVSTLQRRFAVVSECYVMLTRGRNKRKTR